jgi:methanogenic corrinoid protein MtbC1
MEIEHGISISLKQLRKHKKLTQKELASIIGIGQTAIANYENGKRFPDEKNLVKIADYFEISLDSLIGRDFLITEDEKPLSTGFSYTPTTLGKFTDRFMDKSQRSSCDAVKFILDHLEDGFSEEQILLDLIEPALKRAGELWAEGRYNEAMEHQLSMTVVQSMLTMKTLSVPPVKYRGKFVALTAAGELHNIGIRMLSRFLEIDGWESYFLGSSVPASSLVNFIEVNSVDLVLVSATLNENTDALCSMIKAVKSADNPPVVMAGGRATSLNRKIILDSGADFVFSSISKTMEFVRKNVPFSM